MWSLHVSSFYGDCLSCQWQILTIMLVNYDHRVITGYVEILIIIIIIIIITDVAISGDRNVIKKEADKTIRYKDLTIETQSMWNVKTKVIPVTMGATGTISKSFRKYASNIPGKRELKELQKTVILGTAHILRKVLM